MIRLYRKIKEVNEKWGDSPHCSAVLEPHLLETPIEPSVIHRNWSLS
jgi:hypothetical protein